MHGVSERWVPDFVSSSFLCSRRSRCLRQWFTEVVIPRSQPGRVPRNCLHKYSGIFLIYLMPGSVDNPSLSASNYLNPCVSGLVNFCCSLEFTRLVVKSLEIAFKNVQASSNWVMAGCVENPPFSASNDSNPCVSGLGNFCCRLEFTSQAVNDTRLNFHPCKVREFDNLPPLPVTCSTITSLLWEIPVCRSSRLASQVVNNRRWSIPVKLVKDTHDIGFRNLLTISSSTLASLVQGSLVVVQC